MPHHTRPTIDEYFVAMLKLVAARSTCARRAVGAIVVDEHKHVIATGYNGTPSGFAHCIDEACPGARDPAGDTRRCLSVHAEINAIIQASQLKDAHTLYVSCTPCFSCAKAIANTCIKRIVALEEYNDRDALLVLEAANITVFITQ